MFTEVTKHVNVPYAKGSIGYTCNDNNHYVYSLASDLYVRTELQYKIFGEVSALRYYLNVVPKNRVPHNTSFNFEIYKGTVYEGSTCVLFSTQAFNVCAGQYLDTEATHAVIDFVNNRVTTEHDVYVVGVLNYELPVHYESPTFVEDYFIYLQDGMTTFVFDSTKYTLLHPMTLRRSNYVGMYLQQNEDSVFEYTWEAPSALSLSTKLTLPQPLLLFSPDKQLTWYKYDFDITAFVEVTPAGTYISEAELTTHGNTFNESTQITAAMFDAEFGTHASTTLEVLSNGYMYPHIVKHSFWLNALDVQNYLWITEQDSKNTILSGIV